MTFKPMLAATLADPKQLNFIVPLYVSPKLDGLRCIIRGGQALSRNLKPFRNEFVQEVLGNKPELEGLDGELIVGLPNEGNVLGRTQSGIMSVEGKPDFTFHVFDHVLDPKLPFRRRLELASAVLNPFVFAVPHYGCSDLEEFLQLEERFLLQGYEGVMARHPGSLYKFGRATMNEHGLIKFKRFTDSEGIVESIEEGVVNENEAQVDLLGRTKRSHHTENFVPSGKVGTLYVKDLKTQELVRVSPGRMTHDMRRHYWDQPHELIGSIVKYKWFDYNTLDAPRFATYQAHRDLEDMS